MKIALQINGGIGKSIAATAVCKAIKTQYPGCELTVISGYPDVFAGNPNVDVTKTPNELNYFYSHYVEGQPENQFFFNDPYLDTDFVHRRGHLIEVWCKMCGVKYKGELPELFITHKEKTTFGPSFQSPKPILLIQMNGGVPGQGDKYAWARDLPYNTAQKVVNAFAAEYNVVQIKRQDQVQLQNVYPVTADFRALAVLIMMSSKRLFIDSFAQHTAAAFGMPSVVCWVANAPSQFGYAMHTNIIANSPTLKPNLRNSVLAKFNITGPPSDFPYNNEDEIFDADKIIAALRGNPQQATEESKKKAIAPVLENV